MASYFSTCVFTFILLIQTHQVSSVDLAGLSKRKPANQSNETLCDLFTGSWVRDDSYPFYQYRNCPLIDAEFNCQLYGRPDSEYQKYRWQPANCEPPRFNGLYFLLQMRGKTVLFVGDSLGRNQWESLICMLHEAIPNTNTQFIKGDPLSTFKFLEYEVSVSFYRAPYLVDIDVVQGKRVLRLDSISGSANSWKGVDVLSFNSGHWWSHRGHLQGWDYMEQGGALYEDMDRLAAFEIGMTTWANWVNSNVDRTKTRVFFQAISPTHYKMLNSSVRQASHLEKQKFQPESRGAPFNAYPSREWWLSTGSQDPARIRICYTTPYSYLQVDWSPATGSNWLQKITSVAMEFLGLSTNAQFPEL